MSKRLKVFILEDEIDSYPRNQFKDVFKNHDVTYAKSCQEAIDTYKGDYDCICLDHDMEGNYEYRPEYPNTGYQFVKWLVAQVFPGNKPEVLLHSQNPVGRGNMSKLLEDHDYLVYEEPFSPKLISRMKAVVTNHIERD